MEEKEETGETSDQLFLWGRGAAGAEGHYVNQSSTMVTESGQKRRRKGE